MSGPEMRDTKISVPLPPKPIRLQYKNAGRKELVFTDGRFVAYEHLPLDHMKLFSKDLILTSEALYYNGSLLGAVDKDHRITWVSNNIFTFPITN